MTEPTNISAKSLLLHFIADDLGIDDPYKRVNAVSLTRAIREKIAAQSRFRDELVESLRNCVDGLGCQPGYVNTLALQRANAVLAKCAIYWDCDGGKP